MYVDKSLTFADAYSYTNVATAGTYYATDWVDLSTVGTRILEKEPYLIVRIGTAFTTGTSLTFSLVSSTAAATDVAGTSLGTTTVELTSATILTASLTANTEVWKVRLPPVIARRYLGIKIVSAASSSFDAGTLDIFITPQAPFGFSG